MKRIEEYINRQKETTPSPLLQSRIMAKIEQEPKATTTTKASPWQNVAVAASMAVVVALGVMIGNNYSLVSEDENITLSVNDSHIENFLIITADEE